MTMTTLQALVIAGAVTLGTVITRFLPFLLFPDNKPVPKVVEYLGRTLPAAMMGLLLVYCLRNGLPLDMDVYDLAEWCCMADLTKLSIENSSAPVAIPDFTRGAWNKVKGYRHAFAK